MNKATLTGLLAITVMPMASQAFAFGYCYGYSCGGQDPGNTPQQQTVNTCDDQVIALNLQKLTALNIVSISGLAPLANGYCGMNPDCKQDDKCAKADALAKAVDLLAPLAVQPQG